MDDLSHWDFAERFSGYDAAALILGLEPNDSNTEQCRIRVVTNRMELHYKHAYWRLFWETEHDPEHQFDSEADRPIELLSVKMDDLSRRCWLYGEETPLSDWVNDNHQILFENQEFSRHSIARWLSAIGMKSVYQFDLRKDSITPTAIVQTDQDIDPVDLPFELDAANMAYRAVLNGYGDKSDTFKNRLIDYLQTTCAGLKPEAVQRIATVANPDKSAGRKKAAKE